MAASPGAFWSIRDGNLYYTAYQRVENTNWDILCSVDFWSTFEKTVPALVLMAGLTVLGCLCLLWFVRRYIAGQMQIVDMLVHSVEELEKRVYQDERPEDVDFQEVLRLTINGLSDSLTGVVTRSVFLNQGASLLDVYKRQVEVRRKFEGEQEKLNYYRSVGNNAEKHKAIYDIITEKLKTKVYEG